MQEAVVVGDESLDSVICVGAFAWWCCCWLGSLGCVTSISIIFGSTTVMGPLSLKSSESRSKTDINEGI